MQKPVVTVGGSATGDIEGPGDGDWFAVELIEGQEYRIDLEGWRTSAGTLEDPNLLGSTMTRGTCSKVRPMTMGVKDSTAAPVSRRLRRALTISLPAPMTTTPARIP